MTYPAIDFTHDAALTSWVESANGHPEFPVQNLPPGVFSPAGQGPRIGVAIGDRILDLAACVNAGLIEGPIVEALKATTLNSYMGLEAADRLALRHALSRLLSNHDHRAAVEPLLHASADCALHLPAAIGDYTDFYVGIRHAENVGKLFRPDNPLLPNYKHVPIGYHGRASSVRVSGQPVVRPKGQTKAPDAELPTFGPCKRLDYELELGVWVGRGNALGEPIPIAQATDHIAGFCLLNDWSARDVQAWEYVPLGPFLAKNFLSTVSPWVITVEAMAPFFTDQPARAEGDPKPLPYLWDEADQAHGALSIDLEVHLSSANMRADGEAAARLSKGGATNMYWTVAQIVTHHASNGCNLSPGDLIGTGTISAPEHDGFGSLLELSRGGAEPIAIPGGERRFLEDGDEVTLSAHATAPGRIAIGFGPCKGMVVPSV
jgi:fumarylacetoacetase